MRLRLRAFACAIAVCALGVPAARAQDAWTLTGDANIFFGYNYQQRLFADFSAWESQNWVMGSAAHDAGPGQLTFMTMLSLEPWTVDPQGSPQLFQTGESYQSVPLVNYQHQHDFIMGLGATWRVDRGSFAWSVGADVVGEPALGPTAFMHRESSRNNPQVPLTHHYLDSTHVTPGVVRGGVEKGDLSFEASVFRGEEPDENRKDIDELRLNSWSARVGWKRGPWSAQFSGGYLHQPEWFEPYNVTRLTASIGFNGAVASRPLAATLAWGENRQEIVANGVSDGFLLEWDYTWTPETFFYGRAEVAEKELFGLGLHPAGFQHPHFYSHIDALTLGLVRDLPIAPRAGRFGVGGDVTVYHMDATAETYWAGSHSYHVFVRWRPSTMAHHHHH